jgi:hypothetical protein
MSLCYDFQKWTIISLTAFTISLSVGLVLQYAHGYIDPEQYQNEPDTYEKILKYNAAEHLVNYCYQHADRPNPIQDLINQGLITAELGSNCLEVVTTFDHLAHDPTILLVK